MSPYADRCLQLRECRDRLRIYLGFSMALNGVLTFFLFRALMT